jgi:hypothetical protein
MKEAMRMGRKGVDPITGIILVIIISLLVIEAFATANIVISTSAVRQDARETAAISAINGMDFLKRTMQEGVVYATERATYDTLAKGGYNSVPSDLAAKDGIAYWRKHGQTSVPSFKSELETAVAAHFESYGTSYGTSYPFLGLGVSLSVPQYYSCGRATVTDKGSSVGVSITNNCDRGLEASNEFMNVKEANANFSGDAPVNAFGLVAIAKSAFVDADPVLGAVERGVDGTSCRSVSLDEKACSYDGMSDAAIGADVLSKECGNWLNGLRSSISSQLSGISVSGADVSFDLPEGSVSGGYTVGGCKACVPQETTVHKCDGQDIVDCKDCASGKPCTDETVITGYKTTCAYSYSADADVVVALAQKGSSYPIYDAASKTTQWAHMTLRFRVLDGFSGSSQPEPTTSTTTTTVPKPACSSTSCGAKVSDCLCGAVVCGNNRYCCASNSGCYTSQDSCLQNC